MEGVGAKVKGLGGLGTNSSRTRLLCTRNGECGLLNSWFGGRLVDTLD